MNVFPPEGPYDPYPLLPGLPHKFNARDLRTCRDFALARVPGTGPEAHKEKTAIREAALALADPTRRQKIDSDLADFERNGANQAATQHRNELWISGFIQAWEAMNGCTSKEVLLLDTKPHLFVNVDATATDKRAAWCAAAAELLTCYPHILEYAEAEFARAQVLRMVFCNFTRGTAEQKAQIATLMRHLPDMPYISDVLFTTYNGQTAQDIMRSSPKFLERPDRLKRFMEWAASSDRDRRLQYKAKYKSLFLDCSKK